MEDDAYFYMKGVQAAGALLTEVLNDWTEEDGLHKLDVLALELNNYQPNEAPKDKKR